jgi:hypothetical protein
MQVAVPAKSEAGSSLPVASPAGFFFEMSRLSGVVPRVVSGARLQKEMGVFGYETLQGGETRKSCHNDRSEVKYSLRLPSQAETMAIPISKLRRVR